MELENLCKIICHNYADLVALISWSILLFKDEDLLTARRIGRLEAFLNPFEYEQGYGYQIVNGYIAIGAGGLKGLGLGQSVQK